ncbi:hypothetical protein A3L11_04210 [Thermococcus siculi]|uniref:Uncharacterized protein n=2 Tax=Thermococcus siculi TaxID=72803 RepID=A0A2Z2MP81_9EURY|nr:hypothetical protein A3L11_04210 [Thermococcus siculi]
MRCQRVLMIFLLSLFISSSALGWAVVSMALREMRGDNAPLPISILTGLYLDILIPAAVFLSFGYLLGEFLGRGNLEGIGVPTLIGSFLVFLLLTTPLDSILIPWEVSPEGVCRRAPYMPEEYLLSMAFMMSVSSLFIVSWVLASTRSNEPED